MASTSSSGHAQCEEIDFQVDALGHQPGNSLSECIQGIPQPLSATTVMEPTSKLHFLATWLRGYLRYTCVVLGYLATCLPSIQVEERDGEARMTSNAVNREPSVHIIDGNIYADRWVLVYGYFLIQ